MIEINFHATYRRRRHRARHPPCLATHQTRVPDRKPEPCVAPRPQPSSLELPRAGIGHDIPQLGVVPVQNVAVRPVVVGIWLYTASLVEVAAPDAILRSRSQLIVLRGNSGAGKSTVAHGLRAELGRGVGKIDQDTVRRKLLRERDVEHGVNIGLIEHIVRYTLASDYVVILEGILHAGRYGEMLRRLHHDFGGGWYFLQVSWEESLRRHQTRP
jgi:hypothetical protein